LEVFYMIKAKKKGYAKSRWEKLKQVVYRGYREAFEFYIR